MAPHDEQLLTSGQAAKALNATSQTIRNWIRSGRLGSVRIGNRFLVPVAEIERFRGEVSRVSRGESAWEFDGDEDAESLPRAASAVGADGVRGG